MKSEINRRKFLERTVLAGAAGMLIPRKMFSHSETSKTIYPAPSLQGKKVLFVYGGWDGHQPGPTKDVFVPWLIEEGADVEISDNLDVYADDSIMNSIDLIVHTWTMGQISWQQERGLTTAVRNGCGIAGWHGGLGDSFRNNVEFQFMVGGQWVSHPGNMMDYRINITPGNDMVTIGINDFDIHSEQYYMHVDPNIKVLATTRFSDRHAPWIGGAVVPQVWKKYYGKGRVFYSALGHGADDFKIFEVFEIQKRGILWASESKYHPYEEWVTPVYNR